MTKVLVLYYSSYGHIATSVSGRMIVRSCGIDGNRRSTSWMKTQRSWFVSQDATMQPCASRTSTDVEAPRSQPEAATAT